MILTGENGSPSHTYLDELTTQTSLPVLRFSLFSTFHHCFNSHLQLIEILS